MSQLPEIVYGHWDAIVIGTGMGGATVGYALARAGWRVLFCEKGKSTLGSGGLRGAYPETYLRESAESNLDRRRAFHDAGRYCDELADVSHGKPRRFVPFLGSGTGGSSALYGMVLERLPRIDFTPRMHYPRALDSTLPERWPISYADLAPFYGAAERLYGVQGVSEPHAHEARAARASALPPLSPVGFELAEFLRGRGLHPYRLPLACDFVPGCPTCQGYLCARNCKRDSARACLQPALEAYGARLLDNCEVLRLEVKGDAVTGVICRRAGNEFCVSGRTILLAAGALNSPAVLLRSATPDWPTGLANLSGLVGRNLMRHFVDLYAVFPKERHPSTGNAKELGCSDFYLVHGEKFGTLQSFGRLPPAEMLVDGMQQDATHRVGKWASVLFAPAKPFLEPLIGRMFRNALVFATVMEDLPYPDNRVTLSDNGKGLGGTTVRYRIREHDARRIAEFRQRVRAVFKPYRTMLLKQAENNERLAHACGTCRFGTDPVASVVDAHNKAHGLKNLYIVDGSFFPSSGGTNPALTIAANALRVADHLTARSALGPRAGP